MTAYDYAEYFASEDKMVPGDVVGMNSKTGKVRHYQPGDKLMGIISTDPAIIGNRLADKSTHSLVGLMGQVPFNKDQVKVENGKVYTLDDELIGDLLSTGLVYINMSSNFSPKMVKGLSAKIDSLQTRSDSLAEKLQKQEQKIAELEQSIKFLLQQNK